MHSLALQLRGQEFYRTQGRLLWLFEISSRASISRQKYLGGRSNKVYIIGRDAGERLSKSRDSGSEILFSYLSISKTCSGWIERDQVLGRRLLYSGEPWIDCQDRHLVELLELSKSYIETTWNRGSGVGNP